MTRSSLRNKPVSFVPIVNALQARANRQRRRARIPHANNLPGPQAEQLSDDNARPNHVYLTSTVTADGELRTVSSQSFAVRGLSEIIRSNSYARRHIMVTDTREASTSVFRIENQSVNFPTLTDVGSIVESDFSFREGITASEKYHIEYLLIIPGLIQLPNPRVTPPYLHYLLKYEEQDGLQEHFRKNIRLYNSMFQFTSFGAYIDKTINDGSGPFVFRINKQTYHRIGTLLPLQGCRPKFCQLYIYDTQNENENRINAIATDGDSSNINRVIVQSLMVMFDELNEVAKAFRNARDRFEENGEINIRLRLISSRDETRRNYIAPVSTDIAGLIVGNESEGHMERDIIVHHRSDGLQTISNLHPLYMSMQYLILFPYGEDGYHLGMRYRESPLKQKMKRKVITMREYYSYQIQQRHPERSTLLRGGRLFQQYLVDAGSSIQEIRINYIYHHQTEIKVDFYDNVNDAMDKGDTHGRYHGFPDLFITFTCNGNWPEIEDALKFIPGQKPEDRLDIVARVFKLKLNDLIEYLTKNEHFGPAKAVAYSVEFQKRGLPHVHILLWLEHSSAFRNSTTIDKYISAEIPDPSIDPVGYDAVRNIMMHGPCGLAKTNAPCMSEGKCKKHFPKQFQTETKVDDSGYILYRRRDLPFSAKKGSILLDNRFVVPHNLDLVVKYQGHINVEVCTHNRAMKYLFKYLSKGPDRARVVLEKTDIAAEEESNDTNIVHNEIKTYLDCRYLCAYEAAWQIFGFGINHREPAVVRLPIHLRDQQNVYFTDNQSLEMVINREGIEKTMFTQWMVANQKYESARAYLYADFPMGFVWQSDTREWTPRQKGTTIGRIIQVHHAAGQLFYLRLLLNVVRGATSYEYLRTVNGILYPTFQAACEVLGLLGDDREWDYVMKQVTEWATAHKIREVFVALLMFSEVANPTNLFEDNWRSMFDDILYRYQTAAGVPNYNKNLPSPIISSFSDRDNRLIEEETCYNLQELANQYHQMLNSLNPEQREIHQTIRQSIDNNEARLFFVNGHGGTGKTYLWKTLIAGVRSAGKIVLDVASSGIASLLLPGGRTAHSRFKLPLNVDKWSTCEIKNGIQLAKLLLKTSLVIWDEAPMIHKFCFEALDKTMRDIFGAISPQRRQRPFGGLTMVLGGDFRQILPVIPGGTKSDIINASICTSDLWNEFEIFTLVTNMRLLQPGIDDGSRKELETFGDWLLQIGDGSVPAFPPTRDEECQWVQIPEELLIHPGNNPSESIFRAIYTDFEGNYVTYYSSDTLSRSSGMPNEDTASYPSKLLNKISTPGIADHELNLKIGCLVMLMRNINQVAGLCNGTRLMILQLTPFLIEARIVGGDHLGDKLYVALSRVTSHRNLKLLILDENGAPINITKNVVYKEVFGYIFQR
ncbi:DNA helicase PIF1, ATP-dependent [Corchorus olitorius]|uniref:ATP-dependent DNA helicase n=1 Tax=Corchorus olitorius TaxID=93759 RepID=A0A1R3G3U8_9ROSI|nr:DNA helicase PIF1, ATP-dependent [Corchorus olitorius]